MGDGNGAEGSATTHLLPALVFLSRRSSGPSRRMESLFAWVNPALLQTLAVAKVPALVLIKDRRVLGRLEGRATGQQIDELIRPHLAA